jgi:hypothetical protein
MFTKLLSKIQYNLADSFNSVGNLFDYLSTSFYEKAIIYKHGALASISLLFGMGISWLDFNKNYFGISLSFIFLYCILVFLDSLTGIIASKYKGGKVESGKLLFTFYKLLFTFLFFWILDNVKSRIDAKISFSGDSWFYSSAEDFIQIITYSVFTLLSLREWLSIGENIESRFGKKFYLFTLIEKVFDIIESKFLTWLEGTSICKKEEKS